MLNYREIPKEKKDKYTQYIISSSKQLLSLINDIIDISKIEAGQLSTIKTVVDLNKMFKELKNIMEIERNRLEKTEVEIKMNIPLLHPVFMLTDEIRLRQVLFNLLVNALKFTLKGQITFGYTQEDTHTIHFYVKDTGMGIPREIQNAVFERFKQGNLDKDTQISGTGLGLAISRGIVELLGGKIGLISQEDLGSEFFFSLPVENSLTKPE